MTQTLFPTFTYEDARAAIDWLQRALGFEVHEIHEGPDGTIAHAELKLGDQMIMLGTAQPAPDKLGRVQPSRAGGVTATTYVVIDDPDAAFARAIDAGAEVVMPLTDLDYGSRDFAIRDPEGHVWSFGTYRP